MTKPLWSAVVVLVALAPARVQAADPKGTETTSDVVVAREDFVKGAELAKQSQWGEALSAFERSAKLRPHAITTFNVGACQRAMGSYTLAYETLTGALAQNDRAQGRELPEMLVQDARAYLKEIEGLLATVTVTLAPADAKLAVDGRPLFARPPSAGGGNELPTLVAGVRDPGPGEAPLPSAASRPDSPARFRLVINPGTRVLTLARKGFADAVVSRSFAPGSSTDLPLNLDRLPGTIHLASTPAGAAVMLNGVDVGETPVDVARPGGMYHVAMRKPGFVSYDTALFLHPGEEANLSPELPKEKVLITQRWWFWTGLGVLAAGAAVGTALYVRSQEPAPAPTPPSGGTLGWTLQLH